MDKDQAVAQMFASRAKVLENESERSYLVWELVEVLREMVSDAEERIVISPITLIEARRVIAKATGEQA